MQDNDEEKLQNTGEDYKIDACPNPVHLNIVTLRIK